MTDTDWGLVWCRRGRYAAICDAARVGLCQGGRAGDVQGEGVGMMKFDERMVRHTELVMIVAVMIVVLVGYVISKL